METRGASLILLARNPTATVTRGLLPAAHRLGLHVRLLTDHAGQHEREYRSQPDLGYPPPEVEACAVTDVQAILAALDHAGPRPIQAVASNSDHLQTQTALVAHYLGLPGKDWRSAIRARDKGLMRVTLRRAGLDHTPFTRLRGMPSAEQLDAVTYPAVLKPVAGVASEDVAAVADRAELNRYLARTRQHRDDDLLAEGLITGSLHTLETIGDGSQLRVWGGYATTLSPSPSFIEERLTWNPPSAAIQQELLTQLAALRTGFGPCHTEYILTDEGPVIVEVNDRLIGDQCDFAMADLLGEPIFDDVLRIHLGHPVPPPPGAEPAYRAGQVHSIVADRAGRLSAAPGVIGVSTQTPDGPVRIDYQPSLLIGTQIQLTGSNRDFLGIVRVLGPNSAVVDHTLTEFLSAHQWLIE